MARLTRKELVDMKNDRFTVEVQHGVEYVNDHRKQVLRWSLIGAAVLVAILGIYFYTQHEATVRAQALQDVFRIQNAQVGPATSEYAVAFNTASEKETAVRAGFTDILTRYSGSNEAAIAQYYLAIMAADKGNMAEAEKRFQQVVDSGSKDYASLAKMSLAQIYASENKLADGKKLLQSLIDKPTVLVSKEEATIAYAQLIAPSDPQRARKMLEPLRTDRSAVSRTALTALSDINTK